MENSKSARYFKYAIGEIILVVIGILIALWINNLNINNEQNKERLALTANIKQELNENLNQFNYRIKRLDDVNKNLIKVLNFSATSSTNEPLDSLKSYVTNVLIIEVPKLNNSRISGAKSSGKFSLLSEKMTTSLTDYETYVTNYLRFIDITNSYFDEDWSHLIIRFNSLENFHNVSYPETNLLGHPELVLNEQALIDYLKEPETYQLLHKYYTKFMIEKAWLKELKCRIESTLEIIKKESL
ncbi:hypothetical protein [Winogradskyella maritima]|uniref:Uncharacterized protein n=1 Tax=Winogradskyella maritima TaxID=1517766 RepID=A0ABV8AJR4_9FLAO